MLTVSSNWMIPLWVADPPWEPNKLVPVIRRLVDEVRSMASIWPFPTLQAVLDVGSRTKAAKEYFFRENKYYSNVFNSMFLLLFVYNFGCHNDTILRLWKLPALSLCAIFWPLAQVPKKCKQTVFYCFRCFLSLLWSWMFWFVVTPEPYFWFSSPLGCITKNRSYRLRLYKICNTTFE